jgi:hypothetical protein
MSPAFIEGISEHLSQPAADPDSQRSTGQPGEPCATNAMPPRPTEGASAQRHP